MSRTHKDKPWWVQAAWYTPDHDRGCPYRMSTLWWDAGSGRVDLVPCDLPPEPIVSHLVTRWSSKSRPTRCFWEPDYRSAFSSHRYIYTWGPRREERHFDWWGPSRADVRDVLRDAGKCYRGEGDAGDREPHGHHRHHTFGSFSYWD